MDIGRGESHSRQTPIRPDFLRKRISGDCWVRERQGIGWSVGIKSHIKNTSILLASVVHGVSFGLAFLSYSKPQLWAQIYKRIFFVTAPLFCYPEGKKVLIMLTTLPASSDFSMKLTGRVLSSTEFLFPLPPSPTSCHKLHGLMVGENTPIITFATLLSDEVLACALEWQKEALVCG